MSKWTKGPWASEQSMRGDGTPLPEYVITGDDTDVDGENRVVGLAYRGVDATLIASAPALVEALEDARKVIAQIILAATEEQTIDDENGDRGWFTENGRAAMTKIDAALASAKGNTGETK